MTETALERAYKTHLRQEIEKRFPGSLVIINNPNLRQGIPDLLVLIGWFWFALEVKRSETAPYRPNQLYYIDKMNEMSFAAAIYPENEEEILDAIQHTLESRGYTRVPQPQLSRLGKLRGR